MNKPIYVGLTTGKLLRLIIAVVLLVLAGRTFNTSGQTETNLYSFLGSTSDGGNPVAPLVEGSDGNFYGTGVGGYIFPFRSNAYGCVFRISSTGSFTNLHSFSKGDGAYPNAGLVQGGDSDFYGTTAGGGTSNKGTVFRISPSGVLTSLYSFTGVPDGAQPTDGLVQSKDGDFYGTTSAGGNTTNGEAGFGTIFRISPSGSYTNLYAFKDYPTDGRSPNRLVQGSDGNFYGTAHFGGTYNEGTVFRISPSGTYTSLYSFGSFPTDGRYTEAGLVQGSDGNFYGTTSGGGGGYGTVFRISLSSNYTNIYSFHGSPTDGSYPYTSLVQGSDGNLYGTTGYGGTNTSCQFGCGTVFRISLSSIETNLYSFDSYAGDGIQPFAGLIQGSDGNFYGTTTLGGINSSGTVFRISVPLNPPPYPINQITGVQLSGTNIVFNIPSIAYESYQLQFSSSMNPTNWVDVPVSVTNSIGALLTLTNFGGAVGPQGFYRFDITP